MDIVKISTPALFQSTHPTKGDTIPKTYDNLLILISIHSSRVGRYDFYVNQLLKVPEISIHSSRVGRYSNTAQKSVIILLQYYQKTQLFFSSAATEKLNIPEQVEKNSLYPGANPPRFSCELQVRTGILYH